MTVFCTDELLIGASFPDWNIVEIPVTHIRTAPPLLTRQARIKIADNIQPKLLMYRLKSYKQVMGSTFDAEPLKPPIQELARGLGACIVDDPERQAGLVRLLTEKEEQTLQAMSWDPRVTVLEALLTLCHKAKTESVYVGDITIAANEILQQNGEMLEMTSRTVGSKLHSLGLVTSRLDSSGRGFLLTSETRKRIHRLAYDHRIEFRPAWKDLCDHCVELEGEEAINKEANLVS